MGYVVQSVYRSLTNTFSASTGRAHGLNVAKKPRYTAFSKDPAKYLDLDEYLPHRDTLTEDFKWVKPCSMSPEQLFAWASHLFDRQQRKKNGEDIQVLAFYPAKRGNGKARIPVAAGSVEEYIQNLPHVLARHELSGPPGEANGRRPFIPAADASTSDKRQLELSANVLFEPESPGSVSGSWKDRIIFLRKLCDDANYRRLLAWLEKVQVCDGRESTSFIMLTYTYQIRSMLSIPDGWRTRLSWATWSYPNRWLPAAVYEDDLAMISITSFVDHWREHLGKLSASMGYIEHLLLTVGLISRDIYSYQFSNRDPDDVDNTPSYCNSDRLNLSYHEKLMQLVSVVFEHAKRHAVGMWPALWSLIWQ